MTSLFALLPSLGPGEIILLLLLGVLLFGRKLPDVGRYLGKGIVEFKKGIKGVEDDVDPSLPAQTPAANAAAPAEPPRPPARITASAPKFEDSPVKNVTSTPPQI